MRQLLVIVFVAMVGCGGQNTAPPPDPFPSPRHMVEYDLVDGEKITGHVYASHDGNGNLVFFQMSNIWTCADATHVCKAVPQPMAGCRCSSVKCSEVCMSFTVPTHNDQLPLANFPGAITN